MTIFRLFQRTLFLFGLFSGLSGPLAAQETVIDTVIYQVVDEPARFPGCEQLDTTRAARQTCAEQNLLSFLYKNIRYPAEARRQGLEGSVVTRFVVETDGSLSQLETLREPGGGTGAEVQRVLRALNEVGVRFRPGRQRGKVVRSRVTVPVRFRLAEQLPYVLIGRDTVYTVTTDSVAYRNGPAALDAAVTARLRYPRRYADSCRVGNLNLTLLVRPDGSVTVLEAADYHALGFDFLYEAVRAANATAGQWTPARYNGRPVAAAYDIPITFRPSGPLCGPAVTLFEQAQALGAEAMTTYNAGDTDAALAQLQRALALVPQDANLRYLRGQIYMNEQRYPEACADYRAMLRLTDLPEVRDLVRLLCR